MESFPKMFFQNVINFYGPCNFFNCTFLLDVSKNAIFVHISLKGAGAVVRNVLDQLSRPTQCFVKKTIGRPFLAYRS